MESENILKRESLTKGIFEIPNSSIANVNQGPPQSRAQGRTQGGVDDSGALRRVTPGWDGHRFRAWGRKLTDCSRLGAEQSTRVTGRS